MKKISGLNIIFQSNEVLDIGSKDQKLLRSYQALTRYYMPPTYSVGQRDQNLTESDPISESRYKFVGNAKNGGKH